MAAAGRSIRPASPATRPTASVAVGAVSYAGFRSGYSNYGPGLTCVAPADDGEVYNRHQLRLDTHAPEYRDHWVDGVHTQPAAPQTVAFSPERLITLDVPGPRGYAKAAGAASYRTVIGRRTTPAGSIRSSAAPPARRRWPPAWSL